MPPVPTPPASRSGSEAPDTEKAYLELHQSLDALLEQYLYLLDKQQCLQSDLSQRLSSGFLALAHANYTCPPGRRYGSDYYDQRMKATQRISIQNAREDVAECKMHLDESIDKCHCCPSKYSFCLQTMLGSVSEGQASANNHYEDAVVEPVSTDSQVMNTMPHQAVSTQRAAETDASDTLCPKTEKFPETKTKTKTTGSQFNDPIHWYGILVPPSLRAAQASFKGAIELDVLELAETTIEMRALEEKVTRLRTELAKASSTKS